MPLGIAETRNLLTAYEFKTLFIEELGWNRYNARFEIPVNGRTFTLSAIAEKCGMAAFVCGPGTDGRIPDYPTRRKIERHVANSAHEHLIIFTDEKRTTQVWQWVRRERGKPAACREHPYHAGQPGDSLIQKIRSLAVSLEEEESLTLPDVTGRARRAFDVERVTKKFYDRFKAEHAAFISFLDGIPDEGMERWYISLMLNRLMFIYFIQKKGFLGGGEIDYLKNKLAQCRTDIGKDRYYRDFLCPLFFEGFARRHEERSDKARKLLGEVPYLNGGIFMPHQIEQLYGKTIDIPDKAFEKLFEFFDAYHWHLDERPLKKDDEINPDILGYIFEKYINQKQMGAYYTKEDITEYISKNTVIPFLFEAARGKCKVAFEGQRPVWWLLQEEPDRYIYKAMRHGMTWSYRSKSLDKNEGMPLSQPLSLPPDIEEGVDTTKPNLIERRKPWNRAAPPEYGLPTESWREVVSRRKRYEEVRGKLAAGEVRSINDLITYNLDIRQFAQDVIENAEGPELLVAFWKAIEEVTVLDPTCGSGAFLFAALNILDPLYEACLERMRFFLDEWGEGEKKNYPNYYKLFTEILKRLEDHPNPRYFILKSIIVNNLYGVDIMEEAVEICKLRLFLKLVAQIERIKDIEPLPDIDFNIRAGNTLVGFAKLDEVQKCLKNLPGRVLGLVFEETEAQFRRIEEEAEIADRAFRKFREMQTQQGMSPKDFSEAKDNLRSRLRKLTGELNRFLAGEYGISESNIPNKKKYDDAFEIWRKSHQPFHWFAEFYGILKSGGFDVIIGNPPYVEYRKVRVEYSVDLCKYETREAENLYAFCAERSGKLLSVAGAFGMIVPSSIVGLAETLCVRQHMMRRFRSFYVSTYSIRPSKLFDGVDQRLCILVGRDASPNAHRLFSTRYHHWHSEERETLFAVLRYIASLEHPRLKRIAQAGCAAALSVIQKIEVGKSQTLGSRYSHSKMGFLEHYHRSPRYWIRAMDFEQYFKSDSRLRSVHHFRDMVFSDKAEGQAMSAVINSTLFFLWFMAVCNGRNLAGEDVSSFPVGVIHPDVRSRLIAIFAKLMKDYKRNSFVRKRADCEYQEFRPSLSKPIIDEIDRVLARHYGFTEEELDFIINYDIKYRMGQDSEESDET